MTSNLNLEVEFKYSAKNTSVNDFNAFCSGIKNHEQYRVNLGVDRFYTNKEKPDTFFRLREDSGRFELTYKRKTTKNNNKVRVEYNLGIDNAIAAESLIKEFGYEYDTYLNKVNYVHVFPWFVLSYYICFDANMVEIGRFIEIEMREDHSWSALKEMETELKILEKMCRAIGISPEGRIKESLYEMYRSKT